MIDNDLNPLDPDEESVPGVEEPEPDEPIDLDEIEAAYQAYIKDPVVDMASMYTVLDAAPRLITELRATRARLESWRASAVTEYGSTPDDDPEAIWNYGPYGEAAIRDAANTGRRTWMRHVHYGLWQEFATEPPF